MASGSCVFFPRLSSLGLFGPGMRKRAAFQRRWRQIKSQEVVVGSIIEYKAQRMKVEKLVNTMQGRGSNFISAELRVLSNNKKQNIRLRVGEKIELVELSRKLLQYLYHDEKEAHFMDPESFDQSSCSVEVLGNYQYYIQPGEELEVRITEGGDDIVSADTPTFAVTTIESMSKSPGRDPGKLAGIAENGREIKGIAKHVEAGTKIEIKVENEEYVTRV